MNIRYLLFLVILNFIPGYMGEFFTNPERKAQFFWNSCSVSLSSSSIETPFDKVGGGLTLMVALMSLTHDICCLGLQLWNLLHVANVFTWGSGSSTITVQIECHCNWQGNSSHHFLCCCISDTILMTPSLFKLFNIDEKNYSLFISSKNTAASLKMIFPLSLAWRCNNVGNILVTMKIVKLEMLVITPDWLR